MGCGEDSHSIPVKGNLSGLSSIPAVSRGTPAGVRRSSGVLIEAASVSKSKESEDATLGKAFVRRRLGVCACSRGPSGLRGGAYVWRRGVG